MFKSIFRFFFPVVTYEWCVVGTTIGRHGWDKEKRKCKNGVPVGTGYFLTILHCEDEADADECLKEFEEIAERHNKKRYG